MKKSDIFEAIANKVCEVCDVEIESLYSGTKQQMVVDARMLVVQYLRRTGFTNDEIALMFIKRRGCATASPIAVKRKARTMQRLFDSYSQRCLESYAFCLMSQDVKDYCCSTYSEKYLSWMKNPPRV